MRILPPPAYLTLDDLERFWSRVVKTDGCWVMGSQSRPGFNIGGVVYRASAISWLIHTGKFPTLWLCHTCDNPRCVRPDHLFEGTPKDNSQDMIRKGRGGQGRHVKLYRRPAA